MRKISLFLLLFMIMFVSAAFAQDAEIIDVKGKVSIRANAGEKWQEANVGMIVSQGAEITTGGFSRCIVAFDEDRNNTITIRENSQTIIEGIKPGEVSLPKGRVFSIIKDLDQIEDFKVKTPTVVAGARGTGWMTAFINGVSSVSVFEDIVSVVGIDPQGFEVSSVELREDLQMSIDEQGKAEDVQLIEPMERAEWKGVVQHLAPYNPQIEEQLEKMGDDYSKGPKDPLLGQATEFMVKPDGTIVGVGDEGEFIVHPDGEFIPMDENGQPMYGDGGMPPPPEGVEFIVQEDGTVIAVDQNGEPLPPPPGGEFVVQEDGSVMVVDENGEPMHPPSDGEPMYGDGGMPPPDGQPPTGDGFDEYMQNNINGGGEGDFQEGDFFQDPYFHDPYFEGDPNDPHFHEPCPECNEDFFDQPFVCWADPNLSFHDCPEPPGFVCWADPNLSFQDCPPPP